VRAQKAAAAQAKLDAQKAGQHKAPVRPSLISSHRMLTTGAHPLVLISRVLVLLVEVVPLVAAVAVAEVVDEDN
jgi:hypothetical protein